MLQFAAVEIDIELFVRNGISQANAFFGGYGTECFANGADKLEDVAVGQFQFLLPHFQLAEVEQVVDER